MADPSFIDNVKLISLVAKKPILWDKTLEYYKNRNGTQAAWKQIMMALKPDNRVWHALTRQSYVKLIRQRWAHIKMNYYRSYRKIQKQKRTSARLAKPYIYSNKLKFLQKIMLRNEETNNVTAENEDDASETNNVTAENEDDASETIDVSENSTDSDVMEPIDGTPRRIPTDTRAVVSNMADMDPNSNQEPYTSNRHLSFFDGILPTLNSFDDNQTLDFQMGVLKLLKKIKNRRQSQPFPSFTVRPDDASSSNSGYSS